LTHRLWRRRARGLHRRWLAHRLLRRPLLLTHRLRRRLLTHRLWCRRERGLHRGWLAHRLLRKLLLMLHLRRLLAHGLRR